MYEIPKIKAPVEICLITGETFRGKLFLSEQVETAGRDPSIEYFLCKEADSFIPFESDAGNHRLINKEQILFIRTYQTDSEIKNRTPLDPKPLVIYFTNDQTMFGVLYPTQAEETRISDILNQGDQFISLYNDEQKIVINCKQIIYVGSN